MGIRPKYLSSPATYFGRLAMQDPDRRIIAMRTGEIPENDSYGRLRELVEADREYDLRCSDGSIERIQPNDFLDITDPENIAIVKADEFISNVNPYNHVRVKPNRRCFRNDKGWNVLRDVHDLENAEVMFYNMEAGSTAPKMLYSPDAERDLVSAGMMQEFYPLPYKGVVTDDHSIPVLVRRNHENTIKSIRPITDETVRFTLDSRLPAGGMNDREETVSAGWGVSYTGNVRYGMQPIDLSPKPLEKFSYLAKEYAPQVKHHEEIAAYVGGVSEKAIRITRMAMAAHGEDFSDAEMSKVAAHLSDDAPIMDGISHITRLYGSDRFIGAVNTARTIDRFNELGGLCTRFIMEADVALEGRGTLAEAFMDNYGADLEKEPFKGYYGPSDAYAFLEDQDEHIWQSGPPSRYDAVLAKMETVDEYREEGAVPFSKFMSDPPKDKHEFAATLGEQWLTMYRGFNYHRGNESPDIETIFMAMACDKVGWDLDISNDDAHGITQLLDQYFYNDDSKPFTEMLERSLSPQQQLQVGKDKTAAAKPGSPMARLQAMLDAQDEPENNGPEAAL